MDGIIIVDKPKDMTSRDVVDIVGKSLRTKKVGHTGTLDPNATGILVLCVGKALKLAELLTAKDKTYIAEIILGTATDTLDITGAVLEEKTVPHFSKEDIIFAFQKYLGVYMQEAPLYSSIKVNGKKLYEYARNHESVVLPKRMITIHSIELLDDICYSDKLSFSIHVHVSKGTYIRSLARDIGLTLGVPSCMGNLRRIKQGDIGIDKADTLEMIKQGNYHMITIEQLLKNEKIVIVDSDLEKKIINGQILPRLCDENRCVIKDKNGKILAIYHEYEKDKNMMKPYKMF